MRPGSGGAAGAGQGSLQGGPSLLVGAVVVALLIGGCTRGSRQERRASLRSAYCEATVLGMGRVEVETDYLPHVVQCENGNAGFEALKAQAVAARSYLYYRLDSAGKILDGTSDQVYSCGRSPSRQAYRAVQETSGQVLMYRDTQVAGFYVAGAKQPPPRCRGGRHDPTRTEHYVTYNAGRSQSMIQQTALGYMHPRNLANRGAKSQNGAACLASLGWEHDAILRFYYGDDIEIAQAQGPCVPPAPGEPGPGELEPRARAAACTLSALGEPDRVLAALVLLCVAWFATRRVRRRRGKRRRRRRR